MVFPPFEALLELVDGSPTRALKMDIARHPAYFISFRAGKPGTIGFQNQGVER
jgi:hypothetical protein